MFVRVTRGSALWWLLSCYPTTRAFFFFFFNDTATTEIYTLSLHDALPISTMSPPTVATGNSTLTASRTVRSPRTTRGGRSEEHTSELQSHLNLVCRLLLEKKKTHRARTQDVRDSQPSHHRTYFRPHQCRAL